MKSPTGKVEKEAGMVCCWCGRVMSTGQVASLAARHISNRGVCQPCRATAERERCWVNCVSAVCSLRIEKEK